MSTVLHTELDYKIQQMKEYGRIMHGFSDETFKYPVQVRRSHDGEKARRVVPIRTGLNDRRRGKVMILKSRTDDNQLHLRQNESLSKHHHVFTDDLHVKNKSQPLVPPNKTIDDISSLTSTECLSSPNSNAHPIRQHSTATISSTSSDESSTTKNTLIDSSPSRTFTRRFLRKIFHSSKS